MPTYRVRYVYEEKKSDFIITANGKNEAREKAIDVLGALNKPGARIMSISRID